MKPDEDALNSNLILLIRNWWKNWEDIWNSFKFQSDSINPMIPTKVGGGSTTFKFQSDSINPNCWKSILMKDYTLNSNLILLIQKPNGRGSWMVYALNSNLILLILAGVDADNPYLAVFKFQSDSINPDLG